MARTIPLDLLDQIRVASPCPAKWEDMQGDARTRYCGDCHLHVHNLSAMTRDEALALVTGPGGRVCATFFRRADGTILTRDCPIGLAAARARAAAVARRIAAATALVIGSGIALGIGKGSAMRLRQAEPFATVCRWLGSSQGPVNQVQVMGDICVPMPSTNTRPRAGE